MFIWFAVHPYTHTHSCTLTGDGRNSRALKSEWMTVYEGNLLIGGHGKEWIQNGRIVARGSEVYILLYIL